ncbi:putative E3 ubiquitin-protein ligase [Nymphaea thermarum]|nr:putative E3 ubiquitin-protein ligase [Nymphaea thermarum]
MGAQQSKDELLLQQVTIGNVSAIRSLRRDGANLERVDKDGRTPLILACTRGELLGVAECLIELGANLNAYRPGSHGGTPLHHAAKRGLDRTVLLLLSRGANPGLMNDDCQTPLDMARAKGHINVVRIIEGHICLFCGWVRELSGPGILEALAPQWVSKKVWVVVIPSHSRNRTNPQKFELAVYLSLQTAQPRTVISLWKSEIEEPKLNHPDPVLIIFDKNSRTKFKFLSANEGDKEQIKRLCEACRGTPQLSTPATSVTSSTEDLEIAMAINASIQSAMEENLPPFPNTDQSIQAISTNGWANSAGNPSYNGWGPSNVPPPPKAGDDRPASTSKTHEDYWPDKLSGYKANGLGTSEAGPSSVPTQICQGQELHETTIVGTSLAAESFAPSAPPLPEGPVQYPTVDCSPVDLEMPPKQDGSRQGLSKDGDGSSACVICWDAPIEGACIPCGHLAGCMSCLNEIKAKNWGCPVCRAKIEQTMKVYTV